MTLSEFDPGAVVRLRSGGPPMTVIGWAPQQKDGALIFECVVCQWIVDRKHPITGDVEHVIGQSRFRVATLIAEPKDQIL